MEIRRVTFVWTGTGGWTTQEVTHQSRILGCFFLPRESSPRIFWPFALREEPNHQKRIKVTKKCPQNTSGPTHWCHKSWGQPVNSWLFVFRCMPNPQSFKGTPENVGPGQWVPHTTPSLQLPLLPTAQVTPLQRLSFFDLNAESFMRQMCD